MRTFLPACVLALLPLIAGCFSSPPNRQRSPTGTTSSAPDPKKRQQEAIGLLIRKGRDIRVDASDPDKILPTVIDLHGLADAREMLEALGSLQKLKDLNLYATPFSDADLQRLRGLPELNTLNLSATRVTDAGLALMHDLPNLHDLYLNELPVTDGGLAQLRECKLTHLTLFRTRVTDEGLAQLASIKTLQKLTLGECLITDQGLARLKAFPHLHEVNLFHTRVSDSAVEELKLAMPQLKILR